MYFYSPTTNGFYHSDINATIPADAVSLTDARYAEIFAELDSGKVLSFENGNVVTIDAPNVITWESIRTTRNKRLLASDYTQLADYSGNAATWAAYRQLLKDIPQTYAEPADVVWPIPPEQ